MQIDVDLSKTWVICGAQDSPECIFFLLQNYFSNKYTFAALRSFPILIVFSLSEGEDCLWLASELRQQASGRKQSESVLICGLQKEQKFLYTIFKEEKGNKGVEGTEIRPATLLSYEPSHQSLLCHWSPVPIKSEKLKAARIVIVIWRKLASDTA